MFSLLFVLGFLLASFSIRFTTSSGYSTSDLKCDFSSNQRNVCKEDMYLLAGAHSSKARKDLARSDRNKILSSWGKIQRVPAPHLQVSHIGNTCSLILLSVAQAACLVF